MYPIPSTLRGLMLFDDRQQLPNGNFFNCLAAPRRAFRNFAERLVSVNEAISHVRGRARERINLNGNADIFSLLTRLDLFIFDTLSVKGIFKTANSRLKKKRLKKNIRAQKQLDYSWRVQKRKKQIHHESTLTREQYLTEDEKKKKTSVFPVKVWSDKIHRSYFSKCSQTFSLLL